MPSSFRSVEAYRLYENRTEQCVSLSRLCPKSNQDVDMQAMPEKSTPGISYTAVKNFVVHCLSEAPPFSSLQQLLSYLKRINNIVSVK
jgi:hypothetical protein